MQTKKQKVVGIIAEFNPFHNGHRRLIDYAREALHADHVIIAMSGNFVQRGEPAVTDKFTRTRMAVASGADLVFELPAAFSCAAAGDFARAGVSLLEKTGVTDTLLFGTEGSVSLPFLREASKHISMESPEFSAILSRELKGGKTYPKAREAALSAVLSGNEELAALSSPNNILALEYLAALSERSSVIKAETLARSGDGYHAPVPEDASFTSATALRGILQERSLSALTPYVPQNLLPQYEHLITGETSLYPARQDVLGAALSYVLLNQRSQGFSRFSDVSEELANRISRSADELLGFQDRIRRLWTKQYTRSRISRALLHIYLGITKEMCAELKAKDYVPWLRLLGFSENGRALLPLLKEAAKVPVLTNAAAARDVLSEEIRISNLYYSLLVANGKPVPNEYERQIVSPFTP
ncbi:MAG: nucleotidyltransferase family protein [Eubacteriales bacterium]|nr:nucleotidyltransferase family protein [Eubacteriales bacterium]